MEYGDAARRPKGSGMLSQRYREPEDTDGNETIGSGEVHQDNQSLDSWHRRLQSNGNLVASTPTHRRARPSPEVVNSLDELTEISSIAAVVSMQRWWRRRCAGGQRVAQFQKLCRRHIHELVRRRRALHARSKLHAIVLQIIFLSIFTASILHGYTHDRLLRFTRAITSQYLESPFFTSASGSSKTFLGISSSEEFFEWMKGPFISTTYVDSSASSSLTNNRIIGGIRIGQLRVEKLNCSSRVMPFFSWTKVSTDGYTFYCYGSEDGDFSLKTETKSAIQVSNGDSFVFAGCNDTDTDTERSAFFSTMSVSSSQYSLPAPAYSIVLPRADEAQASSIVLALGSNGYIDSQTRAVMVDLSVYNVMLRHVAALRFLVELPASGGAVASLSAGVAPLTDSFLVDADHWFVTTCRVVVILFYMYLFLDEVLWLARSRSRQSQYQAVWQRSSLKHSRCRPKRRPGPLHSRHGSGVRLVGLLCYVCTWLLRLIAQVKRPSDMPLDSDNFVPLRPYVETFRAAQLALGACICLEWIRLLLMLRVTLLVDLLVRAVVCAAPQLLVLLFIVGLVVMGYASACLLVLGSQSDLFQSLPEALRSLVAILLQSGSGASSLLGSSPLALEEVGHDAAGTSTLRTLLLACFLLLNVFVAANLFLVVVYQGYLEAKREIEADRRRLKPPGHNSSGDDYLEPAPLHLDLYHEVVVYLRTLSTKLHGFLLPIFRRRKTAEMQSSVFPADTSGPKLSEIESDDEQDDKLPKEPSSKRQKRQEGPNDNTKLLEGMILQLALQNEALLRAVNELKQDVQALQHSENTSSSDRDLLRRGSVALTVPARVHKQRKGIVNSGSNLVTIPDAQNNQLL